MLMVFTLPVNVCICCSWFSIIFDVSVLMAKTLEMKKSILASMEPSGMSDAVMVGTGDVLSRFIFLIC